MLDCGKALTDIALCFVFASYVLPLTIELLNKFVKYTAVIEIIKNVVHVLIFPCKYNLRIFCCFILISTMNISEENGVLH